MYVSDFIPPLPTLFLFPLLLFPFLPVITSSDTIVCILGIRSLARPATVLTL